MSKTQINAPFLTDGQGNKTAILVPIAQWNNMLSDLQEVEALRARARAAANILNGLADPLVRGGQIKPKKKPGMKPGTKRGPRSDGKRWGRPPKAAVTALAATPSTPARPPRIKGDAPSLLPADWPKFDPLTEMPTQVSADIDNGVHPIRALRLHRGLSAVKIATATGLTSGSSVHTLESRKNAVCRFDTIRRFAEALNVDVHVLQDQIARSVSINAGARKKSS